MGFGEMTPLPRTDQLQNHRVDQAGSDVFRYAEVVVLAVFVRDRDDVGSGGSCGFGAVVAVFEDEHLVGFDAEALGRLQVNLGVRLTVRDILGG